MKRVLITGIAGQDGSYLAEFLVARGCDVFGLVLRNESLKWIDPLEDKLTLIESARYHSQRLRALVLDHCLQHGC